MERDLDLEIKIPADLIIKEFECPVCFGTLKDACLTKCGHSFCKECIEECLNRRHECPNCKHATTIDQVVRNFILDGIIKIVTHEKEKAAKEYYENICNIAKKGEIKGLNPIESVFHKNLQSSFLEFEKYYEELIQRNEKIKHKLKQQDFNKAELEYKLAELDENLEKSVSMIAEAFDKHMKSVSPSPELLPVRVFLKVPKKNLTIDVHIPRTHTYKDLHQIIMDHYQANGDMVEQISEGQFIVHQLLNDESGIIPLDKGPIGRFGIIQGSTIFFDGDIVLKSDAPKQCFTKDFNKGQGMKTNYYHCFNCNTGWICESCAQSCHSTHNTSVSIPNHEPTWACCYCVKKGLCRIPNKDKK